MRLEAPHRTSLHPQRAGLTNITSKSGSLRLKILSQKFRLGVDDQMIQRSLLWGKYDHQCIDHVRINSALLTSVLIYQECIVPRQSFRQIPPSKTTG